MQRRLLKHTIYDKQQISSLNRTHGMDFSVSISHHLLPKLEFKRLQSRTKKTHLQCYQEFTFSICVLDTLRKTVILQTIVYMVRIPITISLTHNLTVVRDSILFLICCFGVNMVQEPILWRSDLLSRPPELVLPLRFSPKFRRKTFHKNSLCFRGKEIPVRGTYPWFQTPTLLVRQMTQPFRRI